MLFVRVQTACLTSKSRMGHLGEGARDGAGRRRDMYGGGGARLRLTSWPTPGDGGGEGTIILL